MAIGNGQQNGSQGHAVSRMSDEDQAWLRWLTERIDSMHLIAEDRVSSALFKKILQLDERSGYDGFAERVFQLVSEIGRDEQGTISVGEMMSSLRLIATMSTPKEKLKFIFDAYDFDASGMIERREFALVIETLIAAQSLAMSPQQVCITICVFWLPFLSAKARKV